ncbi:MAG: TonB-dependent receptor plug domain-containing protein [Aquirufa sp.]
MSLTILSLLSIRMLFMHSDTLNNVVVSATRQASISNTIPIAISKQRIQQNSLNTPESISNIPGIFMQRTNQGGGSAFVRGLTGNQTLLILDGIRFNNSTFRYGPNQYLNTIDPFNLENIEVLRGTGSVQYGSDALSGAIHLFTIQPEFSEEKVWNGTHSTRWASQGMEKSFLNRFFYQSSQLSAIFSLGYKSFGDINKGGNGGIQSPTGFDESNIMAKIRMKLPANWEFETLLQQNQQKNVPVFHKIQLENYAINEMSLQNYQRAYLKLKKDFNQPIFKSIEILASYQKNNEDRKLQKNASSTTRLESDQIQTLGFTSQIKSNLFQAHSSISGIEVYNDLIYSNRKDLNVNKTINLRGLYPDDSNFTSLSAFSLHEWYAKPWEFHTGLRFQQSIAVIPDTTVGKSTISMGAFVYDLGTSYTFNKNATIFFNYSTGFRAPNMDDLGSLGIVDFRYELPAFQLKPEYSFNKTFGLRSKIGSLSSEWVFFHTQLENIINRVKTGETIQSYVVYKKENIDQAYLYGFEINQGFTLNPQLTIKSQISYTFGQNVSQNEPMRRIPPFHGNVQIDYQHSKWGIGINWIFADRQDRLSAGDKSDNRMNPNGTAGWGIINSQFKYQISSHTLVSLQGVNLANIPYRMHGSGIDGMGRSLFVQFTYQW